ncbi:MAG: CoB--CoM heterodisulfide reductase subunit B [Deltaproteobacteria bacterium]|nr:MAG: CoB--CoM heterodisulfide reductase subunit B [Deltaproteobacteria bacterium]
MKYVLFLGCTIPARARNYELSARKVAEAVEIEFVDEERFVCCGFPIKGSNQFSSEVLAGYNLAIGSQNGLGICTLCSSCTSALTEVSHELDNEPAKRDSVNERLMRSGVQYGGGAWVKHFARILYEDIGMDQIKPLLKRDLSGLKIAVHYGCHYLKPSEIYEGFDQVEQPNTLEALVALTGAQVVDYPGKKRCCGGPVLPVDEKVALSVAKEKLDDIKEAGADAICLVCPFCSVLYDGNPKSLESEFEVNYNLPVLYLTQILGLAMGFERKELGLNMNVVKTKDLMKKIPE